MNYLLFGGAISTGKTGTIGKIVMEFFKEKNFDIVEVVRHNDQTLTPVDEEEKNILTKKKKKTEYCGNYFAFLQSTDKQIKIIVSTASDNKNIIENFKRYCDLKKSYDFIIAPIRNENDTVRKDFINFMCIKNKEYNEKFKEQNDIDFITEIPLAKINKSSKYNKEEAKRWYKEKIYSIAQKILAQAPFNIK